MVHRCALCMFCGPIPHLGYHYNVEHARNIVQRTTRHSTKFHENGFQLIFNDFSKSFQNRVKKMLSHAFRKCKPAAHMFLICHLIAYTYHVYDVHTAPYISYTQHVNACVQLRPLVSCMCVLVCVMRPKNISSGLFANLLCIQGVQPIYFQYITVIIYLMRTPCMMYIWRHTCHRHSMCLYV